MWKGAYELVWEEYISMIWVYFVHAGLQVFVRVEHVFACSHLVTYKVANDPMLM